MHKIVVVGGGFAGVAFVSAMKGTSAEITLVDRKNHHLFQPLLYQLATYILSPADIAWPIRQIFRDRLDVTTRLGDVIDVDVEARKVLLADGVALPYDTLVIASGATHAYFGHDNWADAAPGLKTIDDALKIRSRMLRAFENAENASDPDEVNALLTFAVIGGGPTGVELAGMIAEIRNGPMRREFRRIDTRDAKVYLIEAGPRILSAFPERLSQYALDALIERRVDVRTGLALTDCNDDHIVLGDRSIACRTILWAAGVKASPAAQWLKAISDKAGRVTVDAQLNVSGDSDIFVIGDTAAVKRPNGRPVPGVASAAKQQGKYVAGILRNRLSGRPANEPFIYRDQGNLATIGKRAAIVDFGWITLTGWFAWWVWGVAHIFFLIGTRSRFSVAWNWLWIYLRGQRTASLITNETNSRCEKCAR